MLLEILSVLYGFFERYTFFLPLTTTSFLCSPFETSNEGRKNLKKFNWNVVTNVYLRSLIIRFTVQTSNQVQRKFLMFYVYRQQWSTRELILTERALKHLMGW
jgi:hypothetical protein